MHGIQRLPALWHDYPNYSIGELNHSRYEILPNKPLHDVSNYLKNIYLELPSQMTNNEKKIATKVIDQSLNQIQELLYLPEKERRTSKALRFCNTTANVINKKTF